MQHKLSTISQVHAVGPMPAKITTTPRRSYAELQQALVRAETTTERTLCEMLALRQSLQENSDLANRSQIQQQLRSLIKQSQRNGSGFAVLFVQLDHYQDIYQQHGTRIAKQVCELTLARLASAVRTCDMVSQQADDQFLLLITDVKRVYDVVLVAEKLLQKLTQLDGLCQQPLVIEVSIGISRYPHDGTDATLLTERAAAAMLHAQHRGGNQFSLLR
ncbi:GGDEF domain-containing protein [Rheinheimera muenzenbergensis]|uniref:GGDEF domain-containing protein n=1 Tax=Rheinheimera muenzenbergensis TaxID=1193628 RepID=A0ABU8C602_9GAMM